MAATPSPVFIHNASFIEVACGEHFSAAISTNHDLYTWGRSENLQLGYNISKAHAQPSTKPPSRLGQGGSPMPRVVPALAGRVHAVSIGTDHVCAVDQEGQLYTWGRGSFSQLGLGDSKDRVEPSAVPGLTPVIDVSTGWRFTVCVCEDGAVYSWGAGSAGQLGHASKLRRRVPTPVKFFEQWRGSNVRVSTLSCGETHVFALTNEGKLYGWGSNENGRLGVGPEVQDSTIPTEINLLHPVRQVHAGNRHSACVDEGGSVYTWGCGSNGRLGHGTTDDVYVPTKVVSTVLTKHVRVVRAKCGVSHTCALDRKGQLYVWGCGNSGRLGISGSKHDDKVRPVRLAHPHPLQGVDCGANHNVALSKKDGRLVSSVRLTVKVPCHRLIYLPFCSSFSFCSLCSFLFSLFSLFSCKVAWGALGHVSNKGQLGPGSQAEAESSGTGGGGGSSSRGGGGRRRSHPPGDTTDAFQAFAVDSDTTDDDEEEEGEEEIIQGVRLLPRTASTLGLRVKTPPVITDKTLLQELRQEGGADPHPSTTSIQIRANAPPPLPGKLRCSRNGQWAAMRQWKTMGKWKGWTVEGHECCIE